MRRGRHAPQRVSEHYHRAQTPLTVSNTPRLIATSVPESESRGSFAPHSLVVRLAPTALFVGLIAAVLVGRAFLLGSPAHRDAARMGATAVAKTVENAPLDDPPVTVTVNVPGGTTTSVLRNAESSPAFTGYLARPGKIITALSQRVGVVPARRDDTLERIATRTGVTAAALMHANGITDPTRSLTVGQMIRVPPVGTMLHRIKEGDTLEGIARAYRVNLDAITAYPGNSVQQSGDLVSGNWLIVPTTNTPVRDRVVFYQAREGDSLARIAALYGLRDPRTLRWANSLSGEVVLPGQIVAIPPTDGVIHVVERDDLRRATEDAITQIAKNYACTSTPCTDAPTDARVNVLAAAVFDFGPNHLTRGGKLVPGQEILIPGGMPYTAPPPVVIPQNVRLDNPAATSGGSADTTVSTRRVAPPIVGASNAGAVNITARGDAGSAGTSAASRAPVAVVAPVYGGGIVGTATRYLGQYRQPDGVPWAGYCEKFVGDVAVASGMGIRRHPTAIAHAYAGPLYGGRAPAGTLVFFDTSWNAAGHVGIAVGDGTMVSALNGGVVRSTYESTSGYMGWRPVG